MSRADVRGTEGDSATNRIGGDDSGPTDGGTSGV